MTTASQTTWDPFAARAAGALYLAIAVCGGFSIGFVPMQIVADDAATSSANLLGNLGLFRLGLVADSLVILFELALTAILYHMFRHVEPKLAMIALISRAGMVTVMGINMLLWVMPYIVLTGQSGWDTAHTLVPCTRQRMSQVLVRGPHIAGYFYYSAKILFFVGRLPHSTAITYVGKSKL